MRLIQWHIILSFPYFIIHLYKNLIDRRVDALMFQSLLTKPISWKVLPTHPTCCRADEPWILSIKAISFLDKFTFPWPLMRLSVFPSVCKQFLFLLLFELPHWSFFYWAFVFVFLTAWASFYTIFISYVYTLQKFFSLLLYFFNFVLYWSIVD